MKCCFVGLCVFSAELPTCHDLPHPKRGRYTGKKCMQRKVLYIGAVCQLKCHEGYSLHGPGVIKCDNDGSWVPSEESYCKS